MHVTKNKKKRVSIHTHAHAIPLRGTKTPMSTDDWCCLCDDPFEPRMAPPFTFPISPCRACDERTRNEVEHALLWCGETWKCPHPCKGCCLYCEKLIFAARLKAPGLHSLRALAMGVIFKDDDKICALKAIFDKGHPIWVDATPKLPMRRRRTDKQETLPQNVSVCFKLSDSE